MGGASRKKEGGGGEQVKFLMRKVIKKSIHSKRNKYKYFQNFKKVLLHLTYQ